MHSAQTVLPGRGGGVRPVGGERIDKEQPAAFALVRIGNRSRQPGGVKVGHLDSDDAQTFVVGKGRV